MKLAVTGGAGFLGFHVCNQLKDQYDDILVIDIAPIDPSEYPGNVRYVNADIRDEEKMNEVLKGMDAVVHAAAALPLWKTKEIFSVNWKTR